MNDFDLVIIGCGPAGLSALLWASELELNAVALEAEGEPGGQLLRTYNRINNHLGVESSDGREMLEIFQKQLLAHSPLIRTASSVVSVLPDSNELYLEDGSNFSYRALLIATGVRRRELSVPGEAEFQGCGILQSGKHEVESAKGRRAVVIGGGDAAFENALILSDVASRVTLIHRRDGFSARDEFIEAAGSRPNIEIQTGRIVKSINGKSRVESVVCEEVETGIESRIEAETVVVRIGVDPNSEFVSGICETDSRGYIKVDVNGATTSANIYAAGDVANPNSPTISTAVGMAATAVKTIRQVI